MIVASGPIPPENMALLAELEATFGGGLTLPWGWAALDPGPDWPSWYVHAYGPAGLWDTRNGTPRSPFVVTSYAPDPAQPTIRSAVQIWIFRAGLIGSPIALERRCQLGMPERVALAGLDRPHTQTQVEATHAGLALIGHAQTLPLLGRPPRELENNPAKRQQARNMWEIVGHEPKLSNAQIGARIGRSESTVRRWKLTGFGRNRERS